MEGTGAAAEAVDMGEAIPYWPLLFCGFVSGGMVPFSFAPDWRGLFGMKEGDCLSPGKSWGVSSIPSMLSLRSDMPA